MTKRATILVADDQPIVAEALFASLQRWFRVVGVVTELDKIETAVEVHRPDVILLDLSFGQTSSLTILPLLVVRFPHSKFLVLTAHADPVLADAAMAAGAAGYVMKHSAASELRVAIDEVLAGRKYITPKMELSGAGGVVSPLGDVGFELSPRQLAILGLLRTGNTNSAIALQLEISTKTVEYHVELMGRRIGVRGKAQLIRWSEQFFRAKEEGNHGLP